MTVFWTVCTPNYTVMCNLNCEIIILDRVYMPNYTVMCNLNCAIIILDRVYMPNYTVMCNLNCAIIILDRVYMPNYTVMCNLNCAIIILDRVYMPNYTVMCNLNCAIQTTHHGVIWHTHGPKYRHSNDHSNCALSLSCENSLCLSLIEPKNWFCFNWEGLPNGSGFFSVGVL